MSLSGGNIIVVYLSCSSTYSYCGLLSMESSDAVWKVRLSITCNIDIVGNLLFIVSQLKLLLLEPLREKVFVACSALYVNVKDFVAGAVTVGKWYVMLYKSPSVIVVNERYSELLSVDIR